MSENEEKQPEPSFSEKLFDAMMDFYVPAENPESADEMKSTQELIEEMDQMQSDISTDVINSLMVAHGFKLHYTGSGYAWLLKVR